MGYNSRLSGALEITPPLTWGQFKDNEFFEGSKNWRPNMPCIKLLAERQTFDTDQGRTEVITAVAVVPESEDEGKLYSLKQEVQRLVDAFPGHQFLGEFLIEGEESADIWKLVVDERRKVRDIHPRIVWPDGTELRGRHNN